MKMSVFNRTIEYLLDVSTLIDWAIRMLQLSRGSIVNDVLLAILVTL